MSSTEIRKAREYDMAPVAELCRESLTATFGDRASIWSGDDEVDKYIRGNWPGMLVGQQGGNLAGFASLRDGKIDLLWVGLAYRGQGLGQQLMDEVERQISQQYQNISVECFVPDENTIRFYKRRGYSVERAFTDRISGIDKVVMGRSFENP